MISAKQARKESNSNFITIPIHTKLLDINKNKPNYFYMPFTLYAVEKMINRAIKAHETSIKIYNEISDGAEYVLKQNGYKVKWYKNFIKVSW